MITRSSPASHAPHFRAPPRTPSRRHLQSEDLGELAAVEDAARRRRLLREGETLSGAGDEVVLVDGAQGEEELGAFVDAGADAVEDGGVRRS